jgi:hypothetical protein
VLAQLPIDARHMHTERRLIELQCLFYGSLEEHMGPITDEGLIALADDFVRIYNGTLDPKQVDLGESLRGGRKIIAPSRLRYYLRHYGSPLCAIMSVTVATVLMPDPSQFTPLRGTIVMGLVATGLWLFFV